MISFKGRHHQQNIILQCVRWYVAYSLSYRAVDKQGNTIDFLLTAKRDKKAAGRFPKKAIGSSGKSSLINIDKSGANTAAIKQ